MIEPWLLDVLACPRCKGDLAYRSDPEALLCRACGVAYEIRDGIPILLTDEARPLAAEDGPPV